MLERPDSSLGFVLVKGCEKDSRPGECESEGAEVGRSMAFQREIGSNRRQLMSFKDVAKLRFTLRRNF